MISNSSFCEECGENLADGVKFCPKCGTRVPGRSPEQVVAEKESIRSALYSRLQWSGILALIVGLPLLFIGIYILVDINEILNFLITDPYTSALIKEYGLSEEELRSIVTYAGNIAIVSGVCNVLSAILCFIRRYYILAIILCFVGAITAISGFFMLLIGLLAFWFMLSSKLAFKEKEAELEEVLQNIR